MCPETFPLEVGHRLEVKVGCEDKGIFNENLGVLMFYPFYCPGAKGIEVSTHRSSRAVTTVRWRLRRSV